MQRHSDTRKTLSEAQERGTHKTLTCHYCGKSVASHRALEGYDRTKKRRLFFCSAECKQASRNHPDHDFRFSHKRRDTILAHRAGAYGEADDHRWENLARDLTGGGGA
jgi:YHS domain-containing protein